MTSSTPNWSKLTYKNAGNKEARATMFLALKIITTIPYPHNINKIRMSVCLFVCATKSLLLPNGKSS